MGILDGLNQKQPSPQELAAIKAKQDAAKQEQERQLQRQLWTDAQILTIGDDVKRVAKSLVPTWIQENETFTLSPKPFSRRGLPYNGCYCPDGVTEKLTVQVAGGPTYTVTLVAGLNVLNLPDECDVTLQGANPSTFTVLMVWTNYRLN